MPSLGAFKAQLETGQRFEEVNPASESINRVIESQTADSTAAMAMLRPCFGFALATLWLKSGSKAENTTNGCENC